MVCLHQVCVGAAAPSPLNLRVFGNQIPHLSKFSGKMDSGKGDLENFIERFESVAEYCVGRLICSIGHVMEVSDQTTQDTLNS